MIECVKENIYYTKRHKKTKRFFVLFFALIFTVSVFLYYNFVIIPIICEISFDYAYSCSVESVNDSVSRFSENQNNYENLIYIEKNSQGDVVLLRADAYRVNLMSKTIERFSNESLNAKLKQGVEVPFWALSGIRILSGYGRKILFDVLTVSSVECDFSSNFKSVGINQTLHSIYAKVTCVVNLEFALFKKVSQFETNVLIAETVLVGKVPEIILSGNLFS